jgi:hypothetical protein
MSRKQFLTVTALVETATGLGLLALPSLPITLLLGPGPITVETAFIARIFGAALIAIGLSCFLSRTGGQEKSQTGSLVGVLFYNLAAAGLLGYAGSCLQLRGIAIWPAVTLHFIKRLTVVGPVNCLNSSPAWSLVVLHHRRCRRVDHARVGQKRRLLCTGRRWGRVVLDVYRFLNSRWSSGRIEIQFGRAVFGCADGLHI